MEFGWERSLWHDRTPGWRRRVLRVAARDVVLLFVLIAVGELAVRVLAPGYRRFIFSETVTGGHPHVANSLGLREQEFPVVPPEGERRILCLGNSVTRGTGIAQEDTYPKQWQRLLARRDPGGSWFVVNGGGEGQSTERALTFLEEVGLDLRPSLIVLGFSPSMLGVIARQQSDERPGHDAAGGQGARAPRRDVRSLGKRILLGSYLYAFVNANVRSVFYRAGVLRDRLDVPQGAIFAYAFQAPGVDLEAVEQAYAELRSGLARLRDVAAGRGVAFVVLGIPSRFEISALPEDNERGLELRRARIRPLVRLAEYCAELGVPFVDATPGLREARRRMIAGLEPWDDLYIPLDVTHLNAAGQAVVARALVDHQAEWRLSGGR